MGADAGSTESLMFLHKCKEGYQIAMFLRARLDALTDGIFSVAMTLLVLDARLPENLNASDGAGLIRVVAGLWPNFMPYPLSFGLRWLSNIEIRSQRRTRQLVAYLPLAYNLRAVRASWLVASHRLRRDWLYAGHTLLIALISMRMLALIPNLRRGASLRLRVDAFGLNRATV
jgi:TMEM175 potassium channel family protein